MHSWASWAQKNMYLEQACQEGSLTHSPHKKKKKKKRYLCFLFTLLFWKALLRRSSLCTQLSSFPLVIACVWLVLPEFLIFGVQMNLRSHCYAAQNAWGFIWLHEEATENREIFLISAQDCPSVASGPRCVQLSWGSQSFLPPSVIAGNSRDFCKIEK